MTLLAGVDLGKTGCRARLSDGSPVVEGPGAPGLADPGGVDAAAAAVLQVLDRAAGGRPVRALVVGAAGAEAAPDQATALAHRIAERLGAGVGVTSDSVTAHAGALGGRPGTVVAVGTGSVALGLAADGRLTQVDGWGPWLGDDGSGAWIGRTALTAVLRAYDGRGRPTALTEAAVRRYGDLTVLPHTLHADGGFARTAAGFVPDVLTAAADGDPVAASVLARAAEHWAELATAAARAAGESRVALVGGLTGAGPLVEAFTALLPAELALTPPLGSSLDGAVLLAGRDDLPHEHRVLRVTPPAAPASGVVDDVDVLATEQVRADLADLDDRDPADVVRTLLEAEATVPAALAGAETALVAAVRLAAAALAQGGRVVYVGAGTPGRLAALDAAECPPTFGTAPDRVVALLAGGVDAAGRAIEGAEDHAELGRDDLLALDPGPADLVVGIAASGRTPYVLAALEAAREHGCGTVAVVNNAGSPAAARADVAVELLTGPEVLSGSTRLKAGSAQKVALNVLSTSAMVANGKTYGAWMVDVVASNEKLRRRARRILREAAGVPDERALAALEASGWRTKPALVALLAGVSPAEADRRLERSGGRVRAAVASTGDPA
ncbi:MAG: N-acetylmuramic acid 6-phosphate etherase [Nocardioidaceae bacterium]